MRERPRVEFETDIKVKVLNTAAIGAIGITSLFVLLIYSRLPQTIPMRWNFSGEVQNWGSRSSVLVLVAIGLAVCIGMTILTKFPRVFNYPHEITKENAERSYRGGQLLIAVLNFVCALLFAVILLHTVLNADLMWLVMVLTIGVVIVPLVYIVSGALSGTFFGKNKETSSRRSARSKRGRS